MKLPFLFCSGIIFSLLLAACNSNNDKKATEPAPDQPLVVEDTSTIEISDSALDVEMIDTFTTTAFSNYAKQQSAGFDWTKFRITSTWIDDSLMTAAYMPDKQFYSEYGKLVKYSPDSSMFVDLDSYNIDIQKNENGRLVGKEMGPDTEISLVNLKSGKKTRLLFAGPDVSVEDALWLDKDNLVLMGVHDYSDSTGKVAAVWKINIPTNTYYLYELHDGSGAAQKIMGRWRKERLKNVLAK